MAVWHRLTAMEWIVTIWWQHLHGLYLQQFYGFSCWGGQRSHGWGAQWGKLWIIIVQWLLGTKRSKIITWEWPYFMEVWLNWWMQNESKYYPIRKQIKRFCIHSITFLMLTIGSQKPVQGFYISHATILGKSIYSDLWKTKNDYYNYVDKMS